MTHFPKPSDNYRRHLDTVLDAARERQRQERPSWRVLFVCLGAVMLALVVLAWCMHGPLPGIVGPMVP